MKKITRIAYNTEGWRRPSGDAGGIETSKTYSREYGFAHEEWLFRNQWVHQGWRYAFLQGVGRSHKSLIEEGAFDVTLYTIEPFKQRRLVAEILQAEAISDNDAEMALKVFRRNGWLKIMQREIDALEGKALTLAKVDSARSLFNVRFRVKNVRMFPPGTYFDQKHPVWHQSRYIITSLTEAAYASTGPGRKRRAASVLPELAAYVRAGTKPTRVSQHHRAMQRKLFDKLKKKFPNAVVQAEKNFVDVLVETETEIRLYEVKSDRLARVAVRNAIGQLLEYEYRAVDRTHRKVRLIVVGPTKLDSDSEQYIKHLRKSYGLPINYEVMSFE